MGAPHRWLDPDVSQGAWVLVVAVVLAAAFGLFRALRDGRFRGTRVIAGGQEASGPKALADGEISLGARATLLQFSSAFCAPCRATRRVLGEVAAMVPGVAHVEIDAEHRLDLVRRLGVLRTPTTLVLDASGREISRAGGAPTKQQVLASLGRLPEPGNTGGRA